MKNTVFILMAGACLSACSPAKAPAAAISQNKAVNKGSKDYKALFGPDYKKGDIGHSKGVLTDKGPADKGVTINRPPRDGYMAFVRSPDNVSVELLQKGEPKAPQEPWASMENKGKW